MFLTYMINVCRRDNLDTRLSR